MRGNNSRGCQKVPPFIYKKIKYQTKEIDNMNFYVNGIQVGFEEAKQAWEQGLHVELVTTESLMGSDVAATSAEVMDIVYTSGGFTLPDEDEEVVFSESSIDGLSDEPIFVALIDEVIAGSDPYKMIGTIDEIVVRDNGDGTYTQSETIKDFSVMGIANPYNTLWYPKAFNVSSDRMIVLDEDTTRQALAILDKDNALEQMLNLLTPFVPEDAGLNREELEEQNKAMAEAAKRRDIEIAQAKKDKAVSSMLITPARINLTCKEEISEHIKSAPVGKRALELPDEENKAWQVAKFYWKISEVNVVIGYISRKGGDMVITRTAGYLSPKDERNLNLGILKAIGDGALVRLAKIAARDSRKVTVS